MPLRNKSLHLSRPKFTDGLFAQHCCRASVISSIGLKSSIPNNTKPFIRVNNRFRPSNWLITYVSGHLDIIDKMFLMRETFTPLFARHLSTVIASSTKSRREYAVNVYASAYSGRRMWATIKPNNVFLSSFRSTLSRVYFSVCACASAVKPHFMNFHRVMLSFGQPAAPRGFISISINVHERIHKRCAASADPWIVYIYITGRHYRDVRNRQYDRYNCIFLFNRLHMYTLNTLIW